MESFDDVINNDPGRNGGGKPGSAKSGAGGGPLSKEAYAEQKRVEREALFELVDNTAMEAAGSGDIFRQYLDTQAQFSRYSATNALLIMAQDDMATKLGSFEHWKKRGGSVMKGEMAISILEPGEPYKRGDGAMAQSYNIKKVFDIGQVDTRKMGVPAPPPQFAERQILAALASKAPMKIRSVDELPDGSGAATDPDTGEITIKRGMSFYDTFRSLAHELGCAEANAIPSGETSMPAPFIAYCASYMLCKRYGVGTQDYNFDGVRGLFGKLDAQETKRELTHIRDVACSVMARMEKNLDAARKPTKDEHDEPGAV